MQLNKETKQTNIVTNYVTGVFQGDITALYSLIICLDYELKILIDIVKENDFAIKNS